MSLPTNKNLLIEYKNPIYIETGIWRGDSIAQAIDAGFETIIGIDNDASAIMFCESRFADLPMWVFPKLITGDSAESLAAILRPLPKETPITFFLDSHWQMLEGTEPGKNPFPLLQELRQIYEVRRKNPIDTIIIDDMLIMQKDIVGYGKLSIYECLHAINPNFKFQNVPNPVINGILVAHP